MAERGGLISTEELAGRIGQANLRIFDCTTYLAYPGRERPRSLCRPARQSILRGRRTFPAPISSTCRASSPTSRRKLAS